MQALAPLRTNSLMAAESGLQVEVLPGIRREARAHTLLERLRSILSRSS
jgi:hypothetical protein